MRRAERIGDNMPNNIICAGVGGQGSITMGMLIAQASAAQGKNVIYTPEYSSAMRGGYARAKIKVDEEKILSPFMDEVNILAVLHPSELELLGPQVLKGGLIMVNSDMIDTVPEYDGVEVVKVPANTIAERVHDPKGMSVVMTGALVAQTGLFAFDKAVETVCKYFEEKELPVEPNKQAFIEGYNFIKQGGAE